MITNVSEVNKLIDMLSELYPNGVATADIDTVKRIIYNQRRSRRCVPVINHIKDELLNLKVLRIDNSKSFPYLNFELYDSPIEHSFAVDLHRAGLAQWTPRYTIGKYRLDFAFVNHRVDVEVDGVTYHGSPDKQRKDMHRDSQLNSKGWVVYRLSAWDAEHDKEKHILNIRELLKKRCRANV